jgi:hypothetical protein
MAVIDNPYPGPILRLTRGKSNLVWIVMVFLVIRVLASAVGVLVTHAIEANSPVAPGVSYGVYATGEATVPDWGVVSRYLIDPWYRWDTGWYIKIAYEGYANDGTPAFAPLYPFLIRIVQYVAFGNYLLAALIVSNVFCLSALILLFDRAWKAFESQATARRTVVFLLAFPTGFFLLAGYTESLFITLVLATLLLAEERRWFWAGVMGGLTTLTRNQGWAILPAIGWLLVASIPEAGSRESPLSEARRVLRLVTGWQGWKQIFVKPKEGWIAVAITMIMALGFQLWLYLSGVRSGLATYSQDWPVRFRPPWEVLGIVARKAVSGEITFNEGVNITFLLVTIVIFIFSVPKVRPALTLYCASSLAMILVRDHPAVLNSFPRHTLTILSVFLILGAWGKNRWINSLLVLIFLLVHIWFLFVYFSWGWVA